MKGSVGNQFPSASLLIKRTVLQRGLALVILAVVMWPLAAWGAARLLVVHASIERADAIVVMSGSGTYKERAQHAAELYRRGVAPRVVLTNDYLKSSWSNEKQKNPYYYERSRDELVKAGVPEKNISVIMVPIRNTFHETQVVRDYADKNQLTRLLVVTSGYHSRRTLWSFRKVFEDGKGKVGIDPAQVGIETPSAGTWWFDSRGWDMVPKEYGKIVYYWFKY